MIYWLMASIQASPSARYGPYIASDGELAYLWGGRGDTEPETVFIYRYGTETWIQQLTSGPHPPAGLSDGGCVILGHNLYLYGGRDKKNSFYGDLYELNTQTWQWSKLSDGSAGGPGKKSGCRMISFQDQLLIVGGYYDDVPTSRQAGARYESEFNDDGIYTNELHCYNVITGTKHHDLKVTNYNNPLPCLLNGCVTYILLVMCSYSRVMASELAQQT